MISCRLLHITRNSKGLPSSRETRIAGEVLELGRGAACQLHLPDHRVNLLHATISRSPDGVFQIGVDQDALMSIDGYMERTAILAAGMEITIGPYRITYGQEQGEFDLSLTVEKVGEHADPVAAKALPVTLSALAISKRRLGFALAAVILVGFLCVPLLARVSPAFETWQSRLPVALTEALNPGALSMGHALFGMKCSACHQRAFQPVSDEACAKCHGEMALHLAGQGSRRPLLDAVRCVDCHAAHEGRMTAAKSGMSQCVRCHRMADVPAAEARDFAKEHPSFQLTMPVGGKMVRVRQDENPLPVENPGLKFSHQIHLNKEGVSSPEGNTVMTCLDCHRLEDSGMHFAAMDMERSCQQSRCHKLRLSGPVNSLVRHGSEKEVMQQLRLAYLNWLADNPALGINECGSATKAEGPARHYLDCADRLARRNAGATLFGAGEESPECALCHDIVETGRQDTPWRVAPLRLNRDWQPRAHFSHARHATSACTDCHDKANSKSSADMAFPSIGKCRECHGGTDAAVGRLSSSCESCHRFHREPGKPAG